jgi:hypothetical protein
MNITIWVVEAMVDVRTVLEEQAYNVSSTGRCCDQKEFKVIGILDILV